MRIESLSGYKYYFRLFREEPIHLKPYLYFLLLFTPLLMISFFYDWDRALFLFVLLGYLSAAVGFFTAYKSLKTTSFSLKKQIYQKMVLDHQKDMVIIQNKRSQEITYVNEAFYKILGFEKDRALSINFQEFVSASDLHWFGQNTTRRFRVTPFNQSSKTIQIQKQNGSVSWMELDRKSLDDDAFTIYTFKDVTDRILLEKANRQLANDLKEQRRLSNRFIKGRIEKTRLIS